MSDKIYLIILLLFIYMVVMIPPQYGKLIMYLDDMFSCLLK